MSPYLIPQIEYSFIGGLISILRYYINIGTISFCCCWDIWRYQVVMYHFRPILVILMSFPFLDSIQMMILCIGEAVCIFVLVLCTGQAFCLFVLVFSIIICSHVQPEPEPEPWPYPACCQSKLSLFRVEGCMYILWDVWVSLARDVF